MHKAVELQRTLSLPHVDLVLSEASLLCSGNQVVRQKLARLMKVVRQSLYDHRSKKEIQISARLDREERSRRKPATDGVHKDGHIAAFGRFEKLGRVSRFAFFDTTFEVAIVAAGTGEGLLAPLALGGVADGRKGC